MRSKPDLLLDKEIVFCEKNEEDVFLHLLSLECDISLHFVRIYSL